MQTTNNKHRTVRHNYNFSEQYRYSGDKPVVTRIKLIQYNEQGVEIQPIKNDTVSFRQAVREDCINWIKITGLSDYQTITRLLHEFDMHPLDVKDVLTPDHVVKVDLYGGRLLIVVRSCRISNKHKLSTDHTCIFVKSNVVLTFTESENTIFKNVIDGLQHNTMSVRTQKSGMLLAFMINSILAELIETALNIEELLEKIEDQLMEPIEQETNPGRYIQACRHATMIISKNSKPLREEFKTLQQPWDHVIDDGMLHIYDELSDQLEYIIQTSDNNVQILSSLENLYVTKNDLKTNLIMKRLTVVSTLFIPVTFLVGLWGMNFEQMPELKWKYGYLLSWGVILFTMLLTWILMKIKKWF